MIKSYLIIVKQQMFSMKLLFNNGFQSITKNLDLLEWPDESKFNVFDKIDIIINKFRFHPKITKLKQKFSIKKKLRLNRIRKNSLKTSLISWNEADGGDIPIIS